jgi:hypothetical protein
MQANEQKGLMEPPHSRCVALPQGSADDDDEEDKESM